MLFALIAGALAYMLLKKFTSLKGGMLWGASAGIGFVLGPSLMKEEEEIEHEWSDYSPTTPVHGGGGGKKKSGFSGGSCGSCSRA